MSSRTGFGGTGTPVAASLAGRLIRHAARQAPRSLAERLEEEWLAELVMQQPSPFAQLRFALGCCWAACVIAHEHSGAASSTGRRPLALEVQSLLPGRSGAFAVVVCVHLGALHLLETLRFPQQPAHGPVVVSLQLSALTPDITSPQTPDPPLGTPDFAPPAAGAQRALHDSQ